MVFQNRDRFDDLLDDALKRYGDVEPRVGLEGRVLANLAAQLVERTIRARRLWAAANVGALIVVAILVGHGFLAKPARMAPLQGEDAQLAPAVPSPKAAEFASGMAPPVRRYRRPVRAQTEAKLRQFPSPRPMSEQELMLREYVERFPEEAVLIAKQQDRFQASVEQAQREIQESSDQEER